MENQPNYFEQQIRNLWNEPEGKLKTISLAEFEDSIINIEKVGYKEVLGNQVQLMFLGMKPVLPDYIVLEHMDRIAEPEVKDLPEQQKKETINERRQNYILGQLATYELNNEIDSLKKLAEHFGISWDSLLENYNSRVVQDISRTSRNDYLEKFIGRTQLGRLTRFTGMMTAATVTALVDHATGNDKLQTISWCIWGLAALQQGLIAYEMFSRNENIDPDGKL